MASRNVETHAAAHENWRRRDFDAAVSAAVENFTYTDHPRGLTVKTRAEFKDWIAAWTQAFSDADITEVRYHDASDTVIAQFIGRGTNDGALGSLPATGRRMSLPFCEILRFDSEGRIVSGDIYYDQLSLLVQLGHAEPPPA